MVRLWAMKWSLVRILQIPQISWSAMNLREQLNLNWTRDKQMQLIHGLNPSNRLLIGCAIQLILLKQKAFHKFTSRRHFKWRHPSASASSRQNLLNPTSRPCQLKSRGRFPQNFNWKTSEGCNEWNSADVIISKLNSITRFQVDYINTLSMGSLSPISRQPAATLRRIKFNETEKYRYTAITHSLSTAVCSLKPWAMSNKMASDLNKFN